MHVDKQTFLQVDTINIGDSLAQSTQNNKFAKSLQYLEKKARDKVNFCRDKLQSIQSIYFGTVISDGCSQACLNYSKYAISFLRFLYVWPGLSQVPRKIYIFLISQVWNAVDFLHTGKHQSLQ